jgi:hypothetical protein
MKAFYRPRTSKLKQFKKSMLLTSLFNKVHQQATYGVVITFNNVKSYEIQAFLKSYNLGFQNICAFKYLYLSRGAIEQLAKLGYNLKFLPKGSYLFYSKFNRDFTTLDFKKAVKSFNPRFYISAVKVNSVFYNVHDYINNVESALTPILSKSLYPFTLSSRIWLSIIRQVHVAILNVKKN